MKSRELRELSDEQLLELYEDKKESMYRLRQNLASGELKDTSEVALTRREVARILTILRERELAAELAQKES
jgi:large subunit ribosomal protein L29